MENYMYLLEKGKEEGIEKNVVGAVIQDKNNKVLIMTRKTDDFIGGIDELPSGNMETGEDILTALTREVKEETNLELEEIVCYINSFDYKSGSRKNARQYNFGIKVKSTENILLTEHDSYSWKDFNEIMKNEKITKQVKETIIKYFNKRL